MSENKREKLKHKNKKNCHSSNKAELKILSSGKRKYLYSRDKPRDITLCVVQ